jgi:transposase InsO family protein
MLEQSNMLARCRGSAEQQPAEPEKVNNLPKINTLTKINPDEVDSPATGEVRLKLVNLLNQYRDVVAKKGEPLGLTNVVECVIDPNPEAGIIYKRQYPLPHSQRAEIDELVDDMLERGVIENSDSAWNAPVIVVRKKDGSPRICIDYRCLNSELTMRRYVIPKIGELLTSFKDAKYFSSCDLESAFWQIPVAEKDREKTAFTTSTGRYQFRRLPFGLKLAPFLFQRCINLVLGEAMGIHALAYIDDIIIASPTLEKHFQSLEVVFKKLRAASLRVKLTKCEFVKTHINFLGHQIGPDGVQLHPSHLEAIRKYVAPTNQDGIRSFLGFLSYFRTFVPEFSKIADPLNKLLKKDQPFEWGPAQEQAMNLLKDKLINAPILKYPDFNREFFMFTDASNVGLGAVLLQADNKGKLHPISYASRSLSETERRYSTTKREALAVLWSLKNYKYLVYGYPVTLFTDHKPLSFLFRKCLPDGALGRWAVLTQEYSPKIIYVKGKLNMLADALSRVPYNLTELQREAQDLKALANEEDLENIPSHIAAVTVEENLPEQLRDRLPLLKWTIEELIQEQRQDPDLMPILKQMEPKTTQTTRVVKSKTLDPTDYLLSSNILHRKINVQRCGQDVTYWAIVIPKTLIKRAVLLVHEHFEFGHLGVARTLAKLKIHFYFENMSKVAAEIIKGCTSCRKYNHLPPQATPVRTSPLPNRPFEEVSMDILGPLPFTEAGNKYILTFIDHLTRYLIIVPIPDRTAHTVANAIRENLFCHYGAPARLISDNALEFTSSLVNNLCTHYHVTKVNITPYRPAANGVVENRNHSIIKLLRIYAGEFSPQWDIYLPEVMIAINTAYNDTLGDNPHYVLFGYDRQHVVLWDTPEPFTPLYNLDSVSEIQGRQAKLVHQMVRTRMYQQLLEYQRKHNLKTKQRPALVLNQRVYLKYRPKPNEHAKLAPKWEGPFTVTKIHTPYNYTLTHTVIDRIRKAHIDDILPCYPFATEASKQPTQGLAESDPVQYSDSEEEPEADEVPHAEGRRQAGSSRNRVVTRSRNVPRDQLVSLP